MPAKDTPPAPTPVTPEDAPRLALETMQKAKFPMLATADGAQPHLRPVSPVLTDGFVVYVANLRAYGKTNQIALNPRVELCYLDDAHDQVRITGVAEILADPVLLETIWRNNPLLRRYLGQPDNPSLIIYRIRPKRIRFMREWALEYHDIPIPRH
ncbi:MAG: pyridoxamine 5'-phosphate oxidase family protein [Verrucomicrobiota bacterium]